MARGLKCLLNALALRVRVTSSIFCRNVSSTKFTSRPHRNKKHTINVDKSIELGLLVPQVNAQEVGVASLIGKREYQEDRYHVKLLRDNILYLGVFDGHGGSLAADFAAESMHKHLQTSLQKLDNQEALQDAFLQVNDSLLQHIRTAKPGRERYSGTTATVCLLVDNLHLYVASVGDSRALLCRRGQAVALTQDHSPDRFDEKKRIEAEGASIISNSLGEPQVNGRLSMTRSIGDFDLKEYGVSAFPECTNVKINHVKDSFLVLVTDGVTFSLTNQEIVNIISASEDAQTAAEQLTEGAISLRSHDNATAVVCPLGAWGQYAPNQTDIMYEFGRSLSMRD